MRKSVWILGISAYYHDSAATLIRGSVDGDHCQCEIVAAAQQERFSRKKHDSSFPAQAIQFCLDYAKISLNDVHHVAFYDKPWLKFERLLETYYATAPQGVRSFVSAIPVWIKEKLFLKNRVVCGLENLGRGELQTKLLFPEHHISHAASAFFASPFAEAAIITTDGVGEYATTTMGVGTSAGIKILKQIDFPHSLGLLYSAFTYYTGFKVNSGEYKVMGLAPYGEPKYVDVIYDKLLKVADDGSFCMNMKYFDYTTGLRMTSSAFNKLFGGKPRTPESTLTQKEMDLAASVQRVTEQVMLKMAKHAHEVTGKKYLTMAGGVALNCVANGKILREGPFEEIWIQPAAGDAGGSLGAALAVWHAYLNKPHHAQGLLTVEEWEKQHPVEGEDCIPKGKGPKYMMCDAMKGAYLGPGFSDQDIEQRLNRFNAQGKHYSDSNELLQKTARFIADGKVIGWFQGRMEFGPRALGNRSIIGDARNKEMQKRMNLKIKYRESFRPFAPSVMVELVNEYFELDRESPYMLLVDYVPDSRRVKMTDEQRQLFGIDKLNIPRSDIPAITHIDYSARIQSVRRDHNPKYWYLLREFYKLVEYGIIVNTSFNVRGEPIVCTPEDAYRCFMRTEMDYLVMGNWILDKQEQPEFQEEKDWRKLYQLD